MRTVLLAAAVSAAALFAQTAETIPFRAILLTSNEVPPANQDASGAATLLAHVVRNSSGQIVSGSVDFLVSHALPANTTITGLHIHRGAAGVNGPVNIDSGISGANPVMTATGRGSIARQGQVRPGAANFQASLDTLIDMTRDPAGFYVNLHTTVFPGGVIRGQLMRAEKLVVMGQMTTAKEVPPVTNVNASGLGVVTVYATRNASGGFTSAETVFDVSYTFPGEATLTGLHIHRGTATEAGPVTIGTDLSGTNTVAVPASGAGAVQRRVEVNMTVPAQVETLEGLFNNPQNFYINLHSTVNPGGVIRSQLSQADVISYPVLMSTANEVPPLPLEASGPGVLTVYGLRADDGAFAAGVVDFDANYRFPGEVEFTGWHIHNGTASENGGVTINTGLSGTNTVRSETGFGNITRVAVVTGGAGLVTMNSMLSAPERHYVNLHSTVNPGGVIRAQTGAAVTTAPAISTVIAAVSDPVLTTLAPGGLITVFGSNLARVNGSLVSFTGRNVPTSLNGVQVSVGGMPAPLLQVTPGYIVAQVPFEVPAGNPAVTASTAAGASSPFTVRVANTAPAIFFDGEGAVATDLNYRLLRSGNEARAGDRIWIFSTGMGQTTNPLSTGVIGQGAQTVSGVTAAIDGFIAPVMAAVSSPQFVGLYQTLVQVPANVAAGSRRVTVTVGGVTSNSATIPVRQ